MITSGIDLFSSTGTREVVSFYWVAFIALAAVALFTAVGLAFEIHHRCRNGKPVRWATAAVVAIICIFTAGALAPVPATHTDTEVRRWAEASGTISWSNITYDTHGNASEALLRLDSDDTWLLTFAEAKDLDRLIGYTGDIAATCSPTATTRLECALGDETPSHSLRGGNLISLLSFGLSDRVRGADNFEWSEPVRVRPAALRD